jgi:hypothetical protein
LKQSPLAYFYDVDTNGFGAMLNYKEQIPTADRWAIAAYIRALQLSQDAKMSDVPVSDRGKLQVTPEQTGTTVERPTNQQHEQTGGPR